MLVVALWLLVHSSRPLTGQVHQLQSSVALQGHRVCPRDMLPPPRHSVHREDVIALT